MSKHIDNLRQLVNSAVKAGLFLNAETVVEIDKSIRHLSVLEDMHEAGRLPIPKPVDEE